jgi:tetratricopeptide (TPR) repeat protein
VGPLLAKGATATMGSVDEPYLAFTPDLATFFSRFTFLGFSFGEAAWASQNTVSWQNLAVGDPLYRPFGVPPERRAVDLEQRDSKLLEWWELMIVNMNLPRDGDFNKAINYLEKSRWSRRSAVLQEKLADLYWSQKKLLYALEAGDQALKLDPSPQQKLRLLLRQAERSAIYGRDQAAFDLYQTLLKDYPDSIDLLAINQKILPLAKSLNKKQEIERCEREIKRLAPTNSGAGKK